MNGPPKHVVEIGKRGVLIRDGGETTRGYSTDAELLKLIRELIAENVAFVDTPAGWPPAAIVGRFHDSGELKESFVAITWRGPGDWITYVVSPRP